MYLVLVSIFLAAGIVGISGHSPQRTVASSDPAEFPWHVSLEKKGIHICGGAIIGKRHILTASHCVCKGIVKHLQVVVGSNVHNSARKTSYPVKRIKIFDAALLNAENCKEAEHDIAVISLKMEIQMNNYAQIIPLPSRDIPESVQAYVSGFGVEIEYPNEACSTTLQRLKVFINGDACANGNFYTAEHELCGTYTDDVPSCEVDSGSPLVYKNAVAGVLGTGFEETRWGKQASYVNVFYFADFIKNAMATI